MKCTKQRQVLSEAAPVSKRAVQCSLNVPALIETNEFRGAFGMMIVTMTAAYRCRQNDVGNVTSSRVSLCGEVAASNACPKFELAVAGAWLFAWSSSTLVSHTTSVIR